uniref:Seven TM Receptor n=1 Tax=Caenorhabditis japonica TaxID=281687 RepID=A0A8R1DJ22_CAEJA
MVWNVKNTMGAAALNMIMTIPFLIIVIFGTRSYKIVKKLKEQGDSVFTKKLQMQLYKALVAQTAIPMIFLFFPIGILFSAPLLHLNIEKGSVLVTFFYSLYPAVDPIPAIFFIDEYRNCFLGIFKKNSIQPTLNKASVVSVDTEQEIS